MESFTFVGPANTPVFLKVTEGCYVRVRDISVIGTGVSSVADGSEVAPPTIVAVHLSNGAYAAFEANRTPEDAALRAADLTAAVCKAIAQAGTCT